MPKTLVSPCREIQASEQAASLDVLDSRFGFTPTPKLEVFLRGGHETPFVVVDLDVVAERYAALREALPIADVYYAVKANPAPEILRLLVSRGSSFDVASLAEIDMCLAAGATPGQLSYGNTIKKQRHIRAAYDKGVRLFAFDSDDELRKLMAETPGATLFCRILCNGDGADWPLSRKFGCELSEARRLLILAAEAGFEVGVSFHVGSQQRHLAAWDAALEDVAELALELALAGVALSLVNIGGGFPGRYTEETPEIGDYGTAILAALHRHQVPVHGRMTGASFPRIIAEPGRYMVADAGVLQTEVVLVSRKSEFDERRWVYLDVGKFGGLAETMDEAIRYRVRTAHDGQADGPVTLAGPTCDSADVLYEKTDYRLPLALDAGDRVEILSAGAYTTTYSAVGFNGFPPLRSFCV